MPRNGLTQASLRERELAVVGLELDPHPALETLRDLEELVVDRGGLLGGGGRLGLRHRRGERLGLAPRRSSSPAAFACSASAFACSATASVGNAASTG